MTALRLFVSHSSRLRDEETSDPQAQANWQLLQDTCCGIRDAYRDDVEILVDYEGLQPSDEWEHCLDEWLYNCHAGVLLLSKRSVQSEWVKKEAQFLCLRAAIEPNFRLFPVLLDSQTPEDLDRDPFFRTLRLSRFQSARGVQSASDIVAALRPRLDEPIRQCSAPRTPFDRIVTAVEKILATDIDDATLAELCSLLPPEMRSTHASLDRRRAPARRLARHLVRDGALALSRFRELIDGTQPLPPRERAEELLRYVRSLWVDAGAARIIADAKEPGSALALNGEFVAASIPDCHTACFTLDRYLERAWPDSSQIRIVPIARLSSAEEIWQSIREGCSPVSALPCRQPPAARVDQQIRKFSGHLIVLLPPSPEAAPDPALLGELKRCAQGCRSLLFIWNVGPEMPPLPLPGLQPILPALLADYEYQQLDEEIQTRSTIQRKYS